MRTMQKFAMFFLAGLQLVVQAEAKEIPVTPDDRDRIIRTEQQMESMGQKLDTKVDGLRSEMISRFEAVDQRFDSFDKRFDSFDKRIDQLFNFLWAFIGIFTAMMVCVFGFAFWDRKLSVAPMKKENAKMLSVLRDYAEHQPKLREILKNAGLM